MNVVERFLKYVSFDTRSDENSESCPSTSKQKILGEYIENELKTIGLLDVSMDQNGYVYGFLPSTVRKNPFLYVVLAAFVIFNVSIQIFMPYLIIYYEVSLGMTDYVLIMAPAIVLASVVTFLWGKVYDKKGFTFSGILSLVMLVAGYAVLYLTRAKLPVFLELFA